MAHYRNLTVDGVDYRYNIGKKMVCIINKDTNEKEVINKENVGLFDDYYEPTLIVTPGMVADYIRGIERTPEKYFPTCEHTNINKMLKHDPFDSEIHGKDRQVYWCQDCFNNAADDI